MSSFITPAKKEVTGWPRVKLEANLASSPALSTNNDLLLPTSTSSPEVTKDVDEISGDGGGVKCLRRPKAVLLSTGSFNPVHAGHVSMLESAKTQVESQGYDVVAGFLSPSSDLYVKPKMESILRKSKKEEGAKASSLRMLFAPSKERLKIIDLALVDSTWLSSASWESEQPRFVDFPQVLEALDEWLHQENFFTSPDDKVVYVCGYDHYHNCGLEGGIVGHDKCRHVCVVPRGGKHPRAPISPYVFIVPDVNEAVEMVSSTKIREHLHSGDWRGLEACCPKVVYDFFRTGSGAALYRKRMVFISFTMLYPELQQNVIPDAVLQDSLFFFGSKRMWFWPQNEEERREPETASYVAKMKESPAVERLLLDKIARNEVFFLKPDNIGIDYGNYEDVSRWFQSLGYKPLILEPAAWNEIEKATPSVRTRQVVSNFQRGDHDYYSVVTLLQHSLGDELDPHTFFSCR